jgi:NADPH:quinone reductase-like Zn-dependent oxidoreductase
MQLATVGSIVFLNMGIKLPSTDTLSPDHKGQGLLIYGASSAVGTTMIQVAKQLGFTVFAIASAKNEKYVKSLGADHFIARDNGGFEKEVVAQIKNSGLSVRYGVDCISTGSTYDISASILSQTREAKSESKLVTVLPWPEDKKLPEGVTTEGAGAFKVFNSEPKVGAWLFNTYLTKQLKDKTLTPSPPVQIVKGGLKSTQEAWDLNKQGVSAKKLVLLVDDE